MDFLRIRDKAKARSAEAGRPAEPSNPPAPAAAAPAPAPAPAAAPAAIPAPAPARAPPTDEETLEGALAARLQDLPSAPDARFATWRPGSGAPPDVAPLAPGAGAPLDPADFALVRPAQVSAREPFLPPPAALPPRELPPPPARSSSDPLDEFLYRDDEDAPAVPGFEAAVPGSSTPAAAGEAREEYITFLLGAEEYAVAIERVREVLRCPPITEVPRAPAHVRGVVSVRGEVVAVIEPRRRLGLPGGQAEAPPSARLLVVDVGDGPVGLLVDAVSSVVRLRPGSIEPCPQGIGGASQEYLAGIGRDGERMFTVLDLGALLRRTQAARRRAEGSTRAG